MAACLSQILVAVASAPHGPLAPGGPKSVRLQTDASEIRDPTGPVSGASGLGQGELARRAPRIRNPALPDSGARFVSCGTFFCLGG
jgi:hypothetical protein